MSGFLNNITNAVGNFFEMDKGLTPNTPSTEPDAFKTGQALSDLGYSDKDDQNKSSLTDTVKSFQSDNGLKVDGVINKNGPTEKAISGALEQRSQTAKPDNNFQNPLPSHVKVTKPESTQADSLSWTGSASFGGPVAPDMPKPPQKASGGLKTGLNDPLASNTQPDVKKAQKAIFPEGNTVQKRIQSMMFDKRYNDKTDTRLQQHVVKQFEKAYPGNLKYDETGKMIQPVPVIKPEEVVPFDPDGELKQPAKKYAFGQNHQDITLEKTVGNSGKRSADEEVDLNDGKNDNSLKTAYDQESKNLFYTDGQGNYFNYDETPADLTAEQKKRLDEQYRQPVDMSDEAIAEVGGHLARRRARDEYDEGRLDATDQAISSTYTDGEQKRIQEYADNNPHPVMPEHHDVWRGSVHEMREEIGIDEKLINEAGNDAIDAMSAFSSYTQLKTKEAKLNAMKKIHKLKEKGHVELADKLNGMLAVSIMMPNAHPTTMSDGDLKLQEENHRKLGSALNDAARIISPNKKVHPLYGPVIDELGNSMNKASGKFKSERERRKRPH